MAVVEANISISVDGFVTGPNREEQPGLGEGGEILHAWLDHPEGQQLIDDIFTASGAVVTSRLIYDGTGGWGEHPPFRMPVFVLTHRAHEVVVRGETTFTFVTDSIKAVITQAATAAGEKLVHIMGGASVIQQALNAGLVDQLHLHVAPVILGAGTPLFAGIRAPIHLEETNAVRTPQARHVTYQVRPSHPAPTR